MIPNNDHLIGETTGDDGHGVPTPRKPEWESASRGEHEREKRGNEPDRGDLVVHDVDHLDGVLSRTGPVLHAEVSEAALLPFGRMELDALAVETLEKGESI